MEENFYKTNCLVTGGAGFIGSNLVESLALSGANVTVLDDLSTGHESNLDSIISKSNIRFTRGSILDTDLLQKVSSEKDYIFHQAAFVNVSESFQEPNLCQKINVEGTINVLEAARTNKVKKVIFASSASIYGDTPNLPKLEKSEKQPKSPYAFCKLICEKYAMMYNDYRKLRTTSLRYFNVYGPKQSPSSHYSAVVPKFISEILNNKSPKIYGDGKQSRDFIFVDDVVQANMKAALSEKSDGYAINIGSSQPTTVKDLADKLISIWGSNLKPKYGLIREGDIEHSLSDISLAKKLLGFNPKYSLEEGLKKTKRHLEAVTK